MPANGSVCTLPLRGSLTTANSEETRAAVMQALSGHDAVILDCAGATEIDLTFVQILVAASRTATQTHKRIEFESPASGPLAEALRRSGFPSSSAISLTQVLSL
ncbi:MAG TPA: STAS domain-containing protein [Roseiarcus sp.]